MSAMNRPLSDRTRKAQNAAIEPDKARRRRLNDELRVHGRGGVITVSISIASGGDEAIVIALKAAAASALHADQEGSSGMVLSQIGPVRWSIMTAKGVRILAIWLELDRLP